MEGKHGLILKTRRTRKTRRRSKRTTVWQSSPPCAFHTPAVQPWRWNMQNQLVRMENQLVPGDENQLVLWKFSWYLWNGMKISWCLPMSDRRSNLCTRVPNTSPPSCEYALCFDARGKEECREWSSVGPSHERVKRWALSSESSATTIRSNRLYAGATCSAAESAEV